MRTEITAKRGSEELASILFKYLRLKKTTGQEELVILTDKYGVHNTKWLIMSLWP